MRYFEECFTVTNIKSAYRKWAFKLHPDKGGIENEFKEMLNQYHMRLSSLDGQNQSWKSNGKQYSKAYEYCYKAEKEILDMFHKIINIASNAKLEVSVEIIGTYIWIKGNTYPIKDILMDNKFKYYRYKKESSTSKAVPMWSWSLRSRNRVWRSKNQSWNMDDIRDVHTSHKKANVKQNSVN